MRKVGSQCPGVPACAALPGYALFRVRHFHRTAGLFDRLARGLRNAGDLEARLGAELALAKQANAILAALRKARSLERGMVDHGLGIELARIDRLLDEAQVHFGIVL